jgi:hypothetical protein
MRVLPTKQITRLANVGIAALMRECWPSKPEAKANDRVASPVEGGAARLNLRQPSAGVTSSALM